MKGISNAGKKQLTPHQRGAATRAANRRRAAGMQSAGANKTANKTTTKKTAAASSMRNRTTARKTGAKKSTTKARSAGREAGESRAQGRGPLGAPRTQRLRPIARAQTLTETIENIAVRAQQPMDTVRRVLQETGRLAEAHLCRGGSGKIALPYLGVQIYRAQQAARPARQLPLFGTGRTIQLRKFPARAIARARVLTSMRDATLR